MCGENVVSRVSPCCLWGITPACAGKTEEHLFYKHLYRDHPRVCGENDFFIIRDGRSEGSPPRVRGKHMANGRKKRQEGITPACAGKTGRRQAPAPLVKDHPRVCGENAIPRYCASDVSGSPPRVRGKRRSTESASRNTRITPACAGKTRSRR